MVSIVLHAQLDYLCTGKYREHSPNQFTIAWNMVVWILILRIGNPPNWAGKMCFIDITLMVNTLKE
jgi:hypothetical protein